MVDSLFEPLNPFSLLLLQICAPHRAVVEDTSIYL